MRSRYLLFALVFISLQSFAEAQQPPPPTNLLTNGSGEDPIPLPPTAGALNTWYVAPAGSQNWTRRSSNPPGQGGTGYYIFPGARPGVAPNGEDWTELFQIVDVRKFEKTIEADKQFFSFTGYMRVYQQDPEDQARIKVEYLNSARGLITTHYDSDYA